MGKIRRKDLTDKRFGRLIVIECVGKNKHGHVLWKCKCDCGNDKIATSSHLLKENTTSCGCYAKERSSNQLKKHGKKNTRLYNIWCSMNERCKNKNYKAFALYGARGITVCEEWNDFQKFYDWAVSNGYNERLTIDRIDNNIGYSPTNCRWSTMEEQQNNRRNNHRCEIYGEVLTLSEISKRYNITYGTLKSRIARGWSAEMAVEKPIGNNAGKNKGKNREISN